MSGPFANRSFTLLWVGDTLSEFGSQATSVAMPLLVLALTGSPGKAGLVGLARSLAYPLAPLPGGVLVDRLDRRRVMIACAVGRALVMGSVVIVLAFGPPPFAQLMLAAFLDAALWSVGSIAERGLLPAVVPLDELGDAVALNQARESVASIGGPPLGGALFGIARGLPFLADAVSFVAAALAVLGVRVRPPADPDRLPADPDRLPADPDADAGLEGDPTAPAQPTAHPRPDTVRRAAAAAWEGVTWIWQRPFFRAGTLLYGGANVTLGAVELLAVLVARRHGAGSAAIGLAFAVIGAGGVLASLLAGPVRRRVSQRVAVILEPWFAALFVPLLLVVHAAVLVGLVVAVSVLPVALSSSVIVGRRLSETPEILRGRVQAAAGFLQSTVAWLGPVGVGELFEHGGEVPAVLALSAWALAVAVAATASRALRAG